MMARTKQKTDSESRKLVWVGYCIECEKWRNNLHTMTNINTGQKRCSICASVLLIKCGSCDGDGYLFGAASMTYSCDECGGQRVVPQQKVGEKK